MSGVVYPNLSTKIFLTRFTGLSTDYKLNRPANEFQCRDEIIINPIKMLHWNSFANLFI